MFLEPLLNQAHSLPLVLLASFAAGILASFTPCIYPMIPVTLGIISAQQSSSMLMNFFLSLSYGVGIATVYATLGYLCASSNLIFGQWLAHPAFIGFMTLLFVYLAGSMFGFYEMYTPRFFKSHSTKNYKMGSFAYSFLFGILTGAAASPCLTPALALLLSFAAQQENPLVAIAVLSSFAMGLSTLLIVLGTFSSAMSFLPRAGSWMIEVKKIFGFLLLGVAAYFMQPLFAPLVISSLYAAICAGAAFYYVHVGLHQSVAFKIPFLLISFMLFTACILILVDGYYQEEGLSLAHAISSLFVRNPEVAAV
jgi:thiol:disulfide interchange protein